MLLLLVLVVLLLLSVPLRARARAPVLLTFEMADLSCVCCFSHTPRKHDGVGGVAIAVGALARARARAPVLLTFKWQTCRVYFVSLTHPVNTPRQQSLEQNLVDEYRASQTADYVNWTGAAEGSVGEGTSTSTA